MHLLKSRLTDECAPFGTWGDGRRLATDRMRADGHLLADAAKPTMSQRCRVAQRAGPRAAHQSLAPRIPPYLPERVMRDCGSGARPASGHIVRCVEYRGVQLPIQVRIKPEQLHLETVPDARAVDAGRPSDHLVSEHYCSPPRPSVHQSATIPTSQEAPTTMNIPSNAETAARTAILP